MAADIITLFDAKQHLNITSTDHDTELGFHVSAATVPIEDVVGPVTAQEVVEVHDGGRYLVLYRPPVIDLTSLEPVLTGGESYAPADLDVDADTGIVRRLNGSGFAGPLRVTYDAGRSPIPKHIQMAARLVVGHSWGTQRRGGLNPAFSGGGEDAAPTPSGFLIPRMAMEYLAADRRAPAVA